MNKFFIGVDPSLTNTGVVVLNLDGGLEFLRNSKQSSFMQEAKKKDVYSRLIALQKFMEEVIAEVPGKIYVGYEDYSFDSVNKAFTTGEIGGVLRTTLLKRGIPVVMLRPSALKKFATNQGFSDKEKMKARAATEDSFFSLLHANTFTSDIADAYFLAKAAWYKFAPEQAATLDTNKTLRRLRLMTVAKGEVYGDY